MKRPERKFGFWLTLTLLALFVGCCWLGYRKYKAEKQASRLFQALRQENTAAVQSALDAGADPNARQMFGDEQPTSLVARIKLLLFEALHPASSETALSEAAGGVNPEIVHLLLNRGALPNLRNGDGSTAIMAVANAHYYGAPADIQPGLQKQKQVMQLLLDKGADINAKSRNGDTALASSVNDGFIGAMDLTVPRFLLEHGADANAKSSSGETLLQWSAESANKTIVPFISLLLDHGASVNVKDSYGWTPLMRASELGDSATIKILLDHGADPNLRCSGSTTPLILAVYRGQLMIVKLELDKGADVNAASTVDRSALFVATQHNRADIVSQQLRLPLTTTMPRSSGF